MLHLKKKRFKGVSPSARGKRRSLRRIRKDLVSRSSSPSPLILSPSPRKSRGHYLWALTESVLLFAFLFFLLSLLGVNTALGD